MNIFYLDKSPSKAARYHCDKHVCKMILETAQILSTVLREKNDILYLLFNGGENINYLGKTVNDLYKSTHKSHPVVKWAARSPKNFEWLLEFGICLCNEYHERYGKFHKSFSIISLIYSLYYSYRDRMNSIYYQHNGLSFWTSTVFTPPEQCMPDQYKVKNNAVEAYRNYYKGEKSKFAVWAHGPTPDWW